MIPNKIDFNQIRNKCFCFVCLRFYLEVVGCWSQRLVTIDGDNWNPVILIFSKIFEFNYYFKSLPIIISVGNSAREKSTRKE